MRVQYYYCRRFTAFSVAFVVIAAAQKVPVVGSNDVAVAAVVVALEETEDVLLQQHPLPPKREVFVDDDALATSELILREHRELLQHIEQEPEQQQQQSLFAFKAWTVDDFPSPSSSSPACHHGRICDPDEILTTLEIDSLFGMIQELEQTKTIPCSTKKQHDNDHDASSRATILSQQQQDAPSAATNTTIVSGIPVQLALAIIRKMDLTSVFRNKDSNGDNDPTDMTTIGAEMFARSLHDKWGVGYRPDVQCGRGDRDGGTGIVIFVSILDRALYISLGGTMESILTNDRLDSIIDEYLKPTFRAGQYFDGLELAIEQIGNYIDQGPPSYRELYGVLIIVGIVALVLLVVDGWGKRRARKQYAHVASHLCQLDRAKAEALQGQYQTTSCPICLEDFRVKKQHSVTTKTSTNESLAHILTERVHLKIHATDLYNNDDNRVATTTASKDDPTMSYINNLVGSDGLPVKLLHCGHVFDETCWAEWVTKGRCYVMRCPICQQVVGGATTTPITTTTTSIGRDRQPEQALRQYWHERRFRLMQLRSRYPQYVGQQQLVNWTQSTYDGSMVLDPTFVQRDPQLPHHSAASSNGNHSSCSHHDSGGVTDFGGGFSSGGDGGHW